MVSVWSTAKNKSENMGQEERSHSQVCWDLKSDFFSSSSGEECFPLWYFSQFPSYREVPVLDMCHCNTECSREAEFVISKGLNSLLATAVLSGISKEYGVLQIGTERINLLNLCDWCVSCHFNRLHMGGGAGIKTLVQFSNVTIKT